MIRKHLYTGISISLILTFCLLLSGCWSYRGLDQIEIVSGLAIDQGSDDTKYKITMEIYDLSSSPKEGGTKQKLVEAEGKSIFDALRNAKKKLLRRPYFSHMEIIFINQKLAKEEGLYTIIDFFFRDSEMRDTLYFAISQEDKAETLFQSEPADSPILSVQMSSSIEEDKSITAATYENDLIGIYKALKSPGVSLTLPVIHLTENQDAKVAELNGIAIFKEDKLIGFIGPEETKFFLMIMDELEGGVLPIQEASNPLKTLDLEIIRCQTKQSFEYKNNQIQVTVEPQLEVFLASVNFPIESINEEDIQRIEDLGEQFIIEQTSTLIKKVQSQYGSDIFGFGNLVYRKNPQLWKKFSNQWDQLFVDLDVQIKPKVLIVNTGFIRNNSPQPEHQ